MSFILGLVIGENTSYKLSLTQAEETLLEVLNQYSVAKEVTLVNGVTDIIEAVNNGATSEGLTVLSQNIQYLRDRLEVQVPGDSPVLVIPAPPTVSNQCTAYSYIQKPDGTPYVDVPVVLNIEEIGSNFGVFSGTLQSVSQQDGLFSFTVLRGARYKVNIEYQGFSATATFTAPNASLFLIPSFILRPN